MEDIATKKLNREKLRENLTRVRSNIQTIRESIGETFADRPILGRLRRLRETIRSEASTRAPSYEHENVIEYDAEKTFKTQDGRTIRVFYLNGKPVHIEELEEPIESVEVQQSQEPVESSRVEVETPLPPRLVKRERPKLKLFEGPRVIEAVRGYIGSLAEREKLETEYHRLRLEHYRRLLENPPKPKKPESESEARGGSHY